MRHDFELHIRGSKASISAAALAAGVAFHELAWPEAQTELEKKQQEPLEGTGCVWLSAEWLSTGHPPGCWVNCTVS
jgi:hypothetical protein